MYIYVYIYIFVGMIVINQLSCLRSTTLYFKKLSHLAPIVLCPLGIKHGN